MFLKTVSSFDGYEGKLTVTDGILDIDCYYYTYPPLKCLNIGTKIKSILAFKSQNIMRANIEDFKVEKLDNNYSYRLIGKVINVSSFKVELGGMHIFLDCSLPKDIKNGEFIEFTVLRLDCEI